MKKIIESVEGIQKKAEEVSERANDVAEKAEDLQYVKLPLVQVMIAQEHQENSDARHEMEKSRLVKALTISIVSGIAAVLLTVGGFLLYLNQYDFSGYEQFIDNTDGDATIEDGIHVNDAE